MKLEYVGPHDAVTVPDLDPVREIRRGEAVEVPEELAERLLEQSANWRKAKAAPAPAR